MQIRTRLQSAIARRKTLGQRVETDTCKLVVLTNTAGDIVATAFEQDLRTAGEDERVRMLVPKPEHIVHELIVPASFRHLPWAELHARLRLHPTLADVVSRARPDTANGHATFEQIEPALREAHATAEADEDQVLEPIEIRRPIVVVPGLLGSDLWSRTPSGRQGSQLWPPYTAERGTLSLAKIGKLDAAVPKVALAGTIFQAVYGELLAALRQMGYEDDPPAGRPRTLWVFPYDWTQSCDDSGRELAAFIANTVLPSGRWDGVDIVNHSMGGVVTRAARELHGAPIRRSAYIASPHNGALDAYLALHPAIGVPFFDKGLDLILATILNTAKPLVLLQRQIVMWKSAYDMLPDDKYRPDQSNPYGRFPASMQGEVLRARAFKASLPPAPVEKHIVFMCNRTKPRYGWLAWRRFIPALSFLGSKPGLPEDAVRHGTVDADGTALQPITVDGSHAWLPSMPVVHAKLHRFLASP